VTHTDDRATAVLLDDDGQRRLELVLADGWRVHDAPGTLAVMRPATDRGWFRTNVLVSRERVHAGFDLATVMAASERHVAGTYDAVEVRGERSVHCGGVDALVRLRAFDVRDSAVRLSQLHALLDGGLEHFENVERDDGDGAADRADEAPARVLYQVIATCLAEDAATFMEAFATMLGSCRVTLSPAGELAEELE
jgi:hypothetical protein